MRWSLTSLRTLGYVRRVARWLWRRRASASLALGAALVGAGLHRLLAPLCPPGAACIFGPPGVAPYVEYAEIPGFWAVYDVQRRLQVVQSPFQLIEVFQSFFHGRILTIDGALMITERDEKNYHEMLAHVPLNYVPTASKVLVIGGGDGGTVTQVVKHDNLHVITWVEIDEMVVHTARRYFPGVCAGSRDRRVRLVIRDAAQWVAEQQFEGLRDEVPTAPGEAGEAGGPANEPAYDVVLIDSTDFNRAEPLFSVQFYHSVKAIMGRRSILCFNIDSPQWGQVRLVQFYNRLSAIFQHVFVYQVFQPTYASGHYSFIFASDTVHPGKEAVDWVRWNQRNISTRYYNPDVHYASFLLPTQLRDVLRNPAPSIVHFAELLRQHGDLRPVARDTR